MLPSAALRSARLIAALILLAPTAFVFADAKSDYLDVAAYLSDKGTGLPAPRRAQNRRRNPRPEQPAPQDPALQTAMATAQAGAEKEASLRGSGDRAIAAAHRNVGDTATSAAAGDYSHTEQQVVGTDADGHPIIGNVNVDDSALPLVVSALGALVTDSTAQAHETAQRTQALEDARARAWDALLPTFPDQFAGPESKDPLFRPDLDLTPSPDAGSIDATTTSPFKARYTVTNTSGRLLHNVTLAVELFHYSSMPDPTMRHVYFVPAWPRNKPLQLSPVFLVDSTICKTGYYVPATEPGGPMGLPTFSPELPGIAGIVRIRLTAWADEARQPATATDIAPRQSAVAHVLLTAAERRLCMMGPRVERADSPLSRRITAQAGDTASTPRTGLGRARGNGPSYKGPPLPGRKPVQRTPEQAKGIAMDHVLRPLSLFLPADSPDLAYANRLLTDPTAARPEALQKRNDHYVAACADGKKYAGSFSKGIMEIDFKGCDPDGKHLTATAICRSDDSSRDLQGWLDTTSNGDKVIFLQPVGGTVGPPPTVANLRTGATHAPNVGSELDTDGTDPHASYCFKLEGDHLTGCVSIGDILREAMNWTRVSKTSLWPVRAN